MRIHLLVLVIMHPDGSAADDDDDASGTACARADDTGTAGDDAAISGSDRGDAEQHDAHTDAAVLGSHLLPQLAGSGSRTGAGPDAESGAGTSEFIVVRFFVQNTLVDGRRGFGRDSY